MLRLSRYGKDVNCYVSPEEDGYIVAESPTLPGCVSQGKTREEALKNIRQAIEGIIEIWMQLVISHCGGINQNRRRWRFGEQMISKPTAPTIKQGLRN
jgi:predicted RNase H-like HicB family nuclease